MPDRYRHQATLYLVAPLLIIMLQNVQRGATLVGKMPHQFVCKMNSLPAPQRSSGAYPKARRDGGQKFGGAMFVDMVELTY